MNETQAKQLGFNLDFGTWTRQVKLHVTIVTYWPRHGRPSFGVYISHGHPGGQYWKNEAPLIRCESMARAEDVAEQIYGVAGSAELALHVDHFAS